MHMTIERKCRAKCVTGIIARVRFETLGSRFGAKSSRSIMRLSQQLRGLIYEKETPLTQVGVLMFVLAHWALPHVHYNNETLL